MNHFWVNTCYDMSCGSKLIFLIHGYLNVSVSFVEAASHSSLNCFSQLVIVNSPWGQRCPIAYIPLAFDDGMLQKVPRFMVWWVKYHTFYEANSSHMVTSWHTFTHSESTTETWVSKCNYFKILNVLQWFFNRSLPRYP